MGNSSRCGGRSNKPLQQTNGALARMVAPFAAERQRSTDSVQHTNMASQWASRTT